MNDSPAHQLRNAFKYLFLDELNAMIRLAESLPPAPTIINIGAGAGTSGLAFAQTRHDAMIFTIDVTNHDSPFGSLYSEREVLKRHGLWSGRIKHLHDRSQNIGANWQWGKVDLVFVDGDHSYLGCLNDLRNWTPHVHQGGFVLVHDYRKGDLDFDQHNDPHPKPLKEVDQAVDFFVKTAGHKVEVQRIVKSMIILRVKQ